MLCCAPSLAFITGQPPNLQDFKGPIKRLWRPSHDTPPPAELPGNYSQRQSEAAPWQPLPPTQGLGGDAPFPFPFPVHSSSPSTSLYSSSTYLFSSDATDTTSTSRSTQSGFGMTAR